MILRLCCCVCCLLLSPLSRQGGNLAKVTEHDYENSHKKMFLLLLLGSRRGPIVSVKSFEQLDRELIS